MKQEQTVFRAKKRYFFTMVLCFLYGGFAILTTLFFVYNIFVRPEFIPENFFRERVFRGPPEPDIVGGDFNQPVQFVKIAFDPIRLVTSPLLVTFLISGIVALGGGIAIWSLAREKEIKSIKQETANHLLLPDEKKVIDCLKNSNFESTQSRLSKETGLNKVQVHRVLKRLESKGILAKHNYGLTNKIILKKEFFE